MVDRNITQRKKEKETKEEIKQVETKKKEKKEVPFVFKLCALGMTLIQVILGIVMVVMFAIYMFYGGGTRFPKNDLVQDPIFDSSSLEKIADLRYPPGNIAVSSTGRIFVSLHPDGHPPYKICELILNPNSKNNLKSPSIYPSLDFQERIQTALSLRIAPDSNGNEILWILDYGYMGLGTPKIIGIDLNTDKEVHHYEFSKDIAPYLSMLNDFQIDSQKQIMYIADAGILNKQGAIVVYDIVNKQARRLLAGHPSVTAKNFKTVVNSTDFTREMVLLGVFTIKPNVDSIALSRDGKWLYYASVNDNMMYKVFTLDLLDTSLSNEELGNRVREYTNKTQSDGMTTDSEGNIYYGDMENSAILRINNKFSTPFTETLFQDDKLRWPDGFSFGPNDYLYVTCSALQHVIFKSQSYIEEHSPYPVFRFHPGFSAPSGQ